MCIHACWLLKGVETGDSRIVQCLPPFNSICYFSTFSSFYLFHHPNITLDVCLVMLLQKVDTCKNYATCLRCKIKELVWTNVNMAKYIAVTPVLTLTYFDAFFVGSTSIHRHDNSPPQPHSPQRPFAPEVAPIHPH